MMNEKMIEKLTTKGFTRWTKGKYDRMYINAKDLGLVCEYYKTGNIHTAEFQGYYISNSEAYRMKAAKTYIDVATEEVSSTNSDLEAAAAAILAEVKAEIEAEEAAEAKEIEWSEDAEFAARIDEYKEEAGYKGEFITLKAKSLEDAKAEAKEYADQVYKYNGYFGIRVFRKTKKSGRYVNAKIEIFQNVAKYEEKSGRWIAASDKWVERTTMDADGREMYKMYKNVSA